MIKRFLRTRQTRMLVDLVSENFVPAPDRIIQLLGLGADAWAHDKTGRSVFSYIISRAPTMECLDAWIKAAGDLSKAPWIKREAQNPIVEALDNVSQLDSFRMRVIDRLLAANASMAGMEADGTSIVERVTQRLDMEPRFHEPLLEKLLSRDHALVESASRSVFLAENQQHYPKIINLIERLRPEVEAAHLSQSTAPAAPRTRPGRRL